MARVMQLVAAFPSPRSGTLDLGPLTIHMYGLMLLLAIAACILVTGYRWTRLGGDWDLVLRVAVWGVAFGVVGARAYHDITSWDEVPNQWWGFAAVWKGGLGVWGGILLGVLAGAWVVRRSGNSIRLFMDAVAPGLLLAQGIGRWGNWWNQELYGKPTTLPWKLHIDLAHRQLLPPKYSGEATAGTPYYHPTFLYEFVYDTVMAGALILIGRRFKIRPPALFALYVSVYTVGRTLEELLRIDPSGHFLGERTNFWVSIVVFVCSTAFFVWWQFIREPGPEVTIRARPSAPPKGPTMAIPRGRIRSGR
jgi:prolipoprotein diacylglyceryl transferase